MLDVKEAMALDTAPVLRSSVRRYLRWSAVAFLSPGAICALALPWLEDPLFGTAVWIGIASVLLWLASFVHLPAVRNVSATLLPEGIDVVSRDFTGLITWEDFSTYGDGITAVHLNMHGRIGSIDIPFAPPPERRHWIRQLHRYLNAYRGPYQPGDVLSRSRR